MPWNIEQRDEEYCVIKEDDGEVEGCHDTREKALAQLAALNASEEKAGDENEKMIHEMEDHNPGPVTFDELEAMHEAQEQAEGMYKLTKKFQMLVGNVMASDIEDKGAAVEMLASELSQRMSAVKEQRPRWQPWTDKAANFIADRSKQAAMKTEDGIKYPASDFAYVPDSEKPSTWKLRMAEKSPGNVTRAQLGRAAAAFSPGGFRGQRVEIPDADVSKVKAKIRAAYKSIGVDEGDIPPALKERQVMVYKSGDTYRWAAIYSNNYRDRDNPAEIISRAAHKSFVKAVDDGDWPMPELLWWHVKGKPLGKADLVFWDEATNCAWASGEFGSKEVAEGMARCTEPLGVSHGMPVEHIRRDEGDSTIITDYRSAEISFLPASRAANELTGVYSKEINMNDEQKLEALRDATGLDPETLGAEVKNEAEKRELESKETTEEAPVPVTAEDVAAALQAVLSPIVAKIEELDGSIKALKEVPPEPASPGDNIMALLKGMSAIGSSEAQVDGRAARHEGPTETKAAPGGQSPFYSISSIVDGSFQEKMRERLGVQQ